MHDTLPFTVQLSADGKYFNVRVPVTHIPRELRRDPSAMNVRLERETRVVPSSTRRWFAPFRLMLRAVR
jgi:hypothetical protein